MKNKIITFGEIMLRLSPRVRHAQKPAGNADTGGNAMNLKLFMAAAKLTLLYHLPTLALTAVL